MKRLFRICLTGAIVVLPLLVIAQRAQAATPDAVATVSDDLFLSVPASTTSVPAGTDYPGERNWHLQLANTSASTTFTDPSITADSSLPVSDFPWLSNVELAPGTSCVPLAQSSETFPITWTLTDSQSLTPSGPCSSMFVNENGPATSFDPGFDSTVSESPAVIPVGGGTQTVTITVTTEAAMYDTSPGVNINVEVVPPANTPQTLTSITVAQDGTPITTECGGPPGPCIGPLSRFTLEDAAYQTTYTFTATLTATSNPGAGPTSPDVQIWVAQTQSNSVTDGGTTNSVTVNDPNFAGTGSCDTTCGDFTFAVGEDAADFQATVQNFFTVDYQPLSPSNPPAPPPGAVSVGSGSADDSGTATATSEGTTATATGATDGMGAITVATYPSDPVSATAPLADGQYFDVSLSSDNDFTSATISDCNETIGSYLYWWNGTNWVPVFGAPVPNDDVSTPLPAGTPTPAYTPPPPYPPCITVVFNATTSPTLAQLTGTPFAVTRTPTRVVTSAAAHSSSRSSDAMIITFSATLTANRRGVDGQTITFARIHGSDLCTGTTNGDGVASCQISESPAASRSDRDYTATFAGNNAYLGSAARGTVGGPSEH